MKRLFPVLHTFSLLVAVHCFGGSATWNLNPGSNDWNTPANWTPATVPNGPSDVATFAGSNVTDIKFSSVATEVSEIVFAPGASSFNIAVDPNITSADVKLTISGAGLTNNSVVTQTLTAGPTVEFNNGTIEFLNAASAGSGTVLTAVGQINSGAFGGGVINFYDSSTAGTASVIAEGATNSEDADGGNVRFYNNATASNASFRAAGASASGGFGGEISFYDDSTAAAANFTIEDGINGGFAGEVNFTGNATAETAQFTVSSGEVIFSDNSTAADATFVMEKGQVTFLAFHFNHTKPTAANGLFIINGGDAPGDSGGAVLFAGGTGGNATLIANSGTNGGSGGTVVFDQADASEARVELFGNGTLLLSDSGRTRTTVGSLEGDGLVELNNDILNVGSNDLSTTFSGVIQGSGSLAKIGSGTLSLSGRNTYAGATTISAGIIRATNKTGSATGAGPVNVTTGTLGGKGIVAGPTTIGTGAGIGAFLAPSIGSNKPATLTIQSSLKFKRDGIYVYIVNTKRNTADQVVSNGVTIESGAQSNFSAIGNKKLPRGQVFTVISNTSATPIAGTFANLPDGSTFAAGRNNFQVSYEGGNGNDLTLTVVQ